MNERVLVADDEPAILHMVCSYLEKTGFQTLSATSGTEALEQFRIHHPDVVVLDIMMPGMDGIDVAREILRTSTTPIIFVTARGDEADKILGLELGADDYVVKPFSLRELSARLKVVLRRSQPSVPQSASEVTLTIDGVRRTVQLHGSEIRLTAIQFDILRLLADFQGQVLTRVQILEKILGTGYRAYEQTINAHVKNIRKALHDTAAEPEFIETIRSVGYKFRENAQVRVIGTTARANKS